MPVKIIVSYDGTANEDDAIALGRVFARAGADVGLAYVRHASEPDRNRETLVQHEAEELLERGAELFGAPYAASLARHVVTDRSTPEGLRALAEAEGADVIVFCSDSHTAKGHIAVGNSAERLLEGGNTAIAIAPAGFARSDTETTPHTIVAVADGAGGAAETAERLAGALGAGVAADADAAAELLVIDSRAGAPAGQTSVSASSAHLIDTARCPVLVVPRGVTLPFGTRVAAVA
jgi:nucleotide-binding universal stress UspA family protein